MNPPRAPERVLVTRTAASNEQWAAALAPMGIQAVGLATIETVPALPSDALHRLVRAIGSYDWVLFTSAAGVQQTHALMEQLQVHSLPRSVAVVGEATAVAARSVGWPVKYQPTRADAATLATELEPVVGRNVAWLGSALADRAPLERLEGRGAIVTAQAVYDTQPVAGVDEAVSAELLAGGLAAAVFASPSAVAAVPGRLTAEAYTQLCRLPTVALGPSVAAALQAAGFTRVAIAAEPTPEAVPAALAGLSRT